MLLTLGVLLLGGAVTLEYLGRLRSFHPESRLNLLDERISNVDEEFLRRSPELRANFSRFGRCVTLPGCSTKSILIERDRIIAREWPDLLSRLMVEKDWGDGSLTRPHHLRFQADLQKAGGAQAVRCFPRIHYYLQEGQIIHTYAGLRCP